MRSFFEKAEKIASAVQRGANLGDILSDSANLQALARIIGEDEIESALTLLTRIALDDYQVRSFTLRKPLEGPRPFDFLHRSVGSWKQFRSTALVRIPTPEGRAHSLVFNPSSQNAWRSLESLPEGSQITVALRTAQGARILAQETLALDRWEAAIDTAQDSADPLDRVPTPLMEVTTAAPATAHPSKAPAPARPKPKAVPTRKSFYGPGGVNTSGKPSGPPVLSFKVVINKMDTFVHAGNAHLIITHMRDYPGKVLFFVMRGDKKAVQLDADSIWGAEIRNGETVLFEFFGPQPQEEFVKELGKKVNKYTQMDKIANE
jgi:hypothetical protein